MIFQTIRSKALALLAGLTVAAVLVPDAYSQSYAEVLTFRTAESNKPVTKPLSDPEARSNVFGLAG